MTKYNYKKASSIWDRLIDIVWDMPDYLDNDLRQSERRYFLRMLTHNEKQKINAYLDWITQFISEMNNSDPEKSKLEKIALEMVFFTN